MKERPSPIMFWIGLSRLETSKKPYIAPELQTGTTPLVKRAAEGYTRNFKNFLHPDIREQDFLGPRAILGQRYKLVLDGEGKSGHTKELFDVRLDPAETKNLITTHAAEAEQLERQLCAWQQSVLQSLTGADYR